MSDQSQGPGWWLASDGKWYPPQAPHPAPASTPKPGMSGCLKAFLIAAGVGVILVVVLVAVVSLAVDEASEELDARQEEILEEATVTECGVDELGDLNARVKVTNGSSERSNYSVEVSFQSPDGATQYDVGTAYANALGAGQTIETDAVTLTDAPDAKFECEVVDVFRFSDE